MVNLPYKKPYQSPELLVKKLITENLTVDDHTHAQKVLSRINYYRFKAYSYPYRSKDSQFLDGIKFSDVEELYHFDDGLRDICFALISKLEIQLRSRLDQVITDTKDDPYWYLNSSLFIEHRNMTSFADEIADKLERSDEDFATHFQKSYMNDVSTQHSMCPPSWIAIELCTLGTINILFDTINVDHFNVGPSDTKNPLNIMAKEFGALSFINLRSWIEVIRQIRNKCAHHSRLFNVKIKTWPRVSRLFSKEYAYTHDRRIYVSIWMLHRMLKHIGTPNNTKNQIQQLFDSYPSTDSKKNSMGFPSNWKEDPHWEL